MNTFQIGDRVSISARRRTSDGTAEHFERPGEIRNLDAENRTVFIGFDDGKANWYHADDVAPLEPQSAAPVPGSPLSLFGDDEVPQNLYGRNGR